MTHSAAPIRRLDPAEIEALRDDMAEAGAAMRAELKRRSAGHASEKAGDTRTPDKGNLRAWGEGVDRRPAPLATNRATS